MTNDTSVFGAKVRETPISGNQDGPEGGMDALLQAMACSVCIQTLMDYYTILTFTIYSLFE